jgi:hypothetical protein
VLCTRAARFGRTFFEGFACTEHPDAALLGDSPFCSANVLTGFRVAASLDTQAQIAASGCLWVFRAFQAHVRRPRTHDQQPILLAGHSAFLACDSRPTV